MKKLINRTLRAKASNVYLVGFGSVAAGIAYVTFIGRLDYALLYAFLAGVTSLFLRASWFALHSKET
jgi:hypothetical protein